MALVLKLRNNPAASVPSLMFPKYSLHQFFFVFFFGRELI